MSFPGSLGFGLAGSTSKNCENRGKRRKRITEFMMNKNGKSEGSFRMISLSAKAVLDFRALAHSRSLEDESGMWMMRGTCYLLVEEATSSKKLELVYLFH